MITSLGKLVPNQAIISKLERALGVKLRGSGRWQTSFSKQKDVTLSLIVTQLANTNNIFIDSFDSLRIIDSVFF